jgi:thiamine transport system ATP-binding protein
VSDSAPRSRTAAAEGDAPTRVVHDHAAARPAGEGTEPGGLSVHGVTVRFDTTTALDDFSLEIAPGEIVALLGPSGCGKSTLLRAVAGLQPVDAGVIRWAGEDLARVPVHERGFGLMFQDGQLFVHRDVAGNVAFGLEMARVGRARRQARVADLLAMVGLRGYERRAVGTLSGGEQQRVALARALAPHPRLLLLDEPLSSLDRSLRERLSGELATILRRTGTTALYVTHDHDEAFAVADRIAVMAGGRTLQVDAPARLWQHPATREIAAFLGYETFLPANADDGAPILVAVPPGAARLVADPVTGAPEPRRRIRILAGHQLQGIVLGERISRGGREIEVRLHVPAGCVISARVERDGPVEIGSEVALELDPAMSVALPVGSRGRRAAEPG